MADKFKNNKKNKNKNKKSSKKDDKGSITEQFDKLLGNFSKGKKKDTSSDLDVPKLNPDDVIKKKSEQKDDIYSLEADKNSDDTNAKPTDKSDEELVKLFEEVKSSENKIKSEFDEIVSESESDETFEKDDVAEDEKILEQLLSNVDNEEDLNSEIESLLEKDTLSKIDVSSDTVVADKTDDLSQNDTIDVQNTEVETSKNETDIQNADEELSLQKDGDKLTGEEKMYLDKDKSESVVGEENTSQVNNMFTEEDEKIEKIEDEKIAKENFSESTVFDGEKFTNEGAYESSYRKENNSFDNVILTDETPYFSDDEIDVSTKNSESYLDISNNKNYDGQISADSKMYQNDTGYSVDYKDSLDNLNLNYDGLNYDTEKDNFDYNKLLLSKSLMTVEDIYSKKKLPEKLKDTVFMIEVYEGTLPENLPEEVKRESVLNILEASDLDVRSLVGDAFNRIDILNNVLEDLSSKNDELNNLTNQKIADLEGEIHRLKIEMQKRSEYKDTQNTTISYEIQRIVNIVEFIDPE